MIHFLIFPIDSLTLLLRLPPQSLRPPVQEYASLCEAVNWPMQCLEWKEGSKGLSFSAWKYPTWSHTLGKTLVSLGLE